MLEILYTQLKSVYFDYIYYKLMKCLLFWSYSNNKRMCGFGEMGVHFVVVVVYYHFCQSNMLTLI